MFFTLWPNSVCRNSEYLILFIDSTEQQKHKTKTNKLIVQVKFRQPVQAHRTDFTSVHFVNEHRSCIIHKNSRIKQKIWNLWHDSKSMNESNNLRRDEWIALCPTAKRSNVRIPDGPRAFLCTLHVLLFYVSFLRLGPHSPYHVCIGRLETLNCR